MQIISLKNSNKDFRKSGFSLAEFLVALAMFLILISSLFGTLIIGVRYYRKSTIGLDAQKTVRDVIDVITTEMRQAVPNPDPGFKGNPPTGYIGIQPFINPTGVLYPNPGAPSTDYVLFNEPDYSFYYPFKSNWFPMDPRNYKKVKYFVKDGNILVREVTLYNADGSFATKYQTEALEFADGRLELKCESMNNPGFYPYYVITVVASDEKKEFSLSSCLTIPTDR